MTLKSCVMKASIIVIVLLPLSGECSYLLSTSQARKSSRGYITVTASVM